MFQSPAVSSRIADIDVLTYIVSKKGQTRGSEVRNTGAPKLSSVHHNSRLTWMISLHCSSVRANAVEQHLIGACMLQTPTAKISSNFNQAANLVVEWDMEVLPACLSDTHGSRSGGSVRWGHHVLCDRYQTRLL